jgi:hypothetical protein
VVADRNLWIPSIDRLKRDLIVAWIKMRGMTAQRLELKALLQGLGTDPETTDAMQSFGILIDRCLLENTWKGEGEDGEEGSEEEWDESSEEEGGVSSEEEGV